MSLSHEDRVLDVLEEGECRRLLTTAVIGRLAFTEGALPAIQPVSFAVHDGHVLIPTRMGSKVAAASRGAVVAFEVDSYDVVARTGWNVTVVGPSRIISDAAEIRALEPLGLSPWAPAPQPCYIAVRIALVRGRRVRARSEAEGVGA